MMCFYFSGVSYAATEQAVFLNDKPIVSINGVKAELIDNSVMVPIRMVVEELGYEVKWDSPKKQVTIVNEDTNIDLFINKKEALVNQENVTLESVPLLRKNVTLVPLRFVGETMGLKVTWDNKEKVVRLYSSAADSTTEIEKKVEEPTQPPVSTATTYINSISFDENALSISLSNNIKPEVLKLTNPNRLVVDLPNTMYSESFSKNQNLDQNNSGVLEVQGNPNVSQVRYALFKEKPSTIRVVIDLKETTEYQITTKDSNVLVIDLTAAEQPHSSEGTNKVIVIDAGHGDFDPGTTGISGSNEKDFNLSLVLKMAEILKEDPSYEVVLTRSDDSYVTRPNRIQMANDLNAAMFISIHANSVLASPQASGTESYYYKESGKKLAETLHKHLIQATEFRDRGVKTNNYEVLRKSNVPAVLLEIGFLSNKDEEATMFTDEFQQKVAQALVDGIKEYLTTAS